MPDDDSADREARRRKKEKRRERAENSADGAEAAAEGCSLPGCDRIGGRGGGGGRAGGGSGGGGSGGGCNGCDACDVCGCDLLLFLQLSTVLLAVAAVHPTGSSGRLVQALIRGYQRGLSRFTPACPRTPSCSAYALTAVETLGPRRGLVAAARRIESCR